MQESQARVSLHNLLNLIMVYILLNNFKSNVPKFSVLNWISCRLFIAWYYSAFQFNSNLPTTFKYGVRLLKSSLEILQSL